MEDVAPRKRRAQRSPTPTKRKRSPHSPHHCESKREEKNSKKKKKRKRSPSSSSSSPSSSSDEGSGCSSQERQRRGHRRSYATWKRSSKLKKLKEGGKNISFLTYDCTFGATDKVLAFVQQFDATFGDEGFMESSKLHHVAMHFQKSARQWWASLRANGEAPKTWKALRASIMKQLLASDVKDKVLTEWRSLKLSPYESIHKYVDKFWDLHLKDTVYKKIEFEEQKQQFCAGLPEDMNEEGSPTSPEYSYWTRSRRRNTQAGEAAEEEDTVEDQEEEEIPTPDSLIFGHLDDRCWYNPNFRGRIPEHVKQKVQAPAVNEVGTGDNQPRPVNFRNWNNRGPNQRFRNQGGWMNQGNQNFQAADANVPCNYCGASGHRQGPGCSLWCKHRTERGIPIIRYPNKPEPSQQPPVQLNAMILEEMEVGTSKKWMNEAIPERSSDSKLQAEFPQEGQVYDIHHFQCDCTKCVNANKTEEKDKAPESMVVTRSGVKGETAKHSEKGKEKFPIDWGEQDQVRKGVMKEINRIQQKQGGPKIQKQADMVQKTDLIGQHSGSYQAPEQSQSIPAKATITLTDEFFSTLMDAPNQMSLRQILSLVPNFAHQFMQRLAQEYGFSVEQKKAWGEEDANGVLIPKPFNGFRLKPFQGNHPSNGQLGQIEIFSIDCRPSFMINTNRGDLTTWTCEKTLHATSLTCTLRGKVKQRSATFSLQATKTQSFIQSSAFFDAARMQTRTSNRSRRSTSSTGADVRADEDVEILMQSPTSRQQGERVTIEHQFIDFKVDIPHLKGFHAQWLQSINLLEYARLPWSGWRRTTEVGIHVSNLVESNGLVGYGVYLSAELVSKVFGLQQGEENHVDRASEQIMDREFGKCEGTRGYHLIKNVANLDRAFQIKWFLERFLLLVKLEYVSRANMLYDRLHSEVFCKDKRKTQRSTKIGPLITAIFSYVRNNAVLRSLSEGDVQANNLQGATASIQATVRQPAATPETRKKKREDIKEDDTQERVKQIYDDLLTAGYSHEVCMDTLNLKKSKLTDLPPSGSKSVKKVLRIKKRKVAEMASDADQEPVGQQSEGIQTANSNFEDIPYARCLESIKLIGDYVGQQKINSNLLINDNEKLKHEVAYLKLEMKNKTVSDQEVDAIKAKLRSTESQLECSLKKINFYSEQMHRRESSARIYKEWMMEWDNTFHQQLEVLSTVNVTLEAENKVLLDRVSACKEVEKKIKECAEDELEIEGCFMSGTDVDTMKMELQKHLEPIWTKMKEKPLEVSSKPYKQFAEEENKEEYMLLQTQYTDLQEKYNLLLKKQLEADQSTEDFKVLEDQQEPCEEMEKTPDNKNLNVLFAGIEQTCAEELKSVEDVPEEGVSESVVAECDDNKIQIIVKESEMTTQEFLADIAKKTDFWLETTELVSFKFRTGLVSFCLWLETAIFWFWITDSGLASSSGTGLSLVQIQDWLVVQEQVIQDWLVSGELGSCGQDELPILSCRESGSSGSVYMEGPQSDETQKVQLLRARLQESNPQTKDIDDGTLLRFLRARSLNVDKALKFLLQHLKWCQTFKPLGFIPETEIAKELKKEKIFLQGLDKLGRPIGVILAARHFTSERNLEEFKRFVVYGFDKAVASLAGGQDKFVLIADLKRYGFKNMDVNGYLAILEILQDHFPERLGKFYILHVPSLFWFGWKVVYPFIDPNVREKIIFVDEKRTTETLLKDIDVTQLPEEFGGQLPLMPIQHVGNSGKACSTL
ncbi:hypothetical protein L7F22_027996 [Adiantum nelumboides]|nr:hypothetical protein [Adiantum nelumboides]